MCDVGTDGVAKATTPCQKCEKGKYDHDMDPSTKCSAQCAASQKQQGQELDVVLSIVDAQLNNSRALYNSVHKMLVAKQSGSNRRQLLKIVLDQTEHEQMGGLSSAWADDVLSEDEILVDDHAQGLLEHALAHTDHLQVNRDNIQLVRKRQGNRVELSVLG